MKRNITYYHHYVNSHNHWKFKLLRSKYGWSGEGKFWALNNMIADAENCILNLNKKNIKVSISTELDFSIEEFDQWINFLISDCELIKSLEGQIYTDMVRENFTFVMKEREAARLRKIKNQTSLSSPKLKLFENSS